MRERLQRLKRMQKVRPAALDGMNFLLSDVRGALGPYLNVFLVTEQHWSQTNVGWVTTGGGLLGLAMQTPVGALIDATRFKRELIVAALAVLAVGAGVIFLLPNFWPVAIANTLMSLVGDVFPPAVAAITLGIVGRKALAKRLGRNSAFDHAGNVAIAAVAGGIGYVFSQKAVFLLVPVCAVLASLAVMSIPADAIDNVRARGGDKHDDADDQAGSDHHGWRAMLTCKPLLIFAGCLFLFHFANGPLLPLVGQKLALAHKDYATAMTSALIIIAQLVMTPIALFVGHNADRIGRRPLLIAGFLALPLRSLAYLVSDDTWWLLSMQVLDGVGAGVVGGVTQLVIADLTRGTGRFNVSQGAIATIQGIGASISGLAAGAVVDHLGYAPAFAAAAAASGAAFALVLLFMPETSHEGPTHPIKRMSAPLRPRPIRTLSQVEAEPGPV